LNNYAIGNGSLGGFFCQFKFGINTKVATQRFFLGLKPTSNPSNVEPSTLTQCIGIGFGASDTNFKLFFGGSAAQTPIDLGANFPCNTNSVDMYEVVFFAPATSSEVHYQVTRLNTGDVATGTLSGAAGVALPLSSQFMAFPWGYNTNNATAAICGWDFAGSYISTDN
jgi:hypothetical protein